MRAPEFWSAPPGWLSGLLSPLGAVYAAATRARLRRPGLRLPVPVICVGNLTAGGTGKTPTVIALIERLGLLGLRVGVVTRGHGGRLRGPLRVDPARHSAADVGDEPLLLAGFAPVFVARDRAAGGRAAVADGAEVVILDDGFQNPALVKDLSILLVDAETGFGNGHCIPAGPLRERVAEGLARAGLVVLVGPGAAAAGCRDRCPVLQGHAVTGAEIRPVDTGQIGPGTRVVAFAGIGRPEKFFATLRGMGAEIVAAHGFADHAPYAPAILTRLVREAAAAGALLVTTDKDAVRLPAAFRGRALPVPVRLTFREPERIDALLKKVVASKSPDFGRDAVIQLDNT